MICGLVDVQYATVVPGHLHVSRDRVGPDSYGIEMVFFFFFFLNFSVMNIVRIRLQKKVEDDFLKDYLVVYIGNEIAERFSTYMTIDDFYLLNEHQVSCLK
jgi:hypothetical protein